MTEQCCCSGKIVRRKEMPAPKAYVEYLYLDLTACDRCIGTDQILDGVMEILAPALKLAGYDVKYDKIQIASEELAIEYRFLSSPTIRVNGEDICEAVTENNCGCCSDISGTEVDCRVFEYRGKTYEVPPKEMLAESVLRAIFAPKQSCSSCSKYELPENLKTFFEGKKNNNTSQTHSR